MNALSPILSQVTSVPMLSSLIRFMTNKELLPKGVWMRLPVAREFEVQVDGASSFIYRSTIGDGIGRKLYWRGLISYEPEVIRPFIKLVKMSNSFWDVGANTGLFSLIASSLMDGDIFAFEPHPGVSKLLTDNIDANQTHGLSKVHLKEEALSDECGSATLYVPNNDVPVGSTLRNKSFSDGGNEVSVRVNTIDFECQENGLSVPDLIKLDAERFELQILRGAKGVFENGARPAVFLECNPDGDDQKLTEFFKERGYQLIHLAERMIEKDVIYADPSARYRNWLALPSHINLSQLTD